MNRIKKGIALIICLTMCVGLCSSFAFADEKVSYLAIGDSTAQGYYTDGFVFGEMGLGDYSSPNSYPFLFRDYLAARADGDVTFYQYTLQGMRPNELYAILAPEAAAPYMDGFCKRHISNFNTAFKNVYGTDVYSAYKNAVETADIITYDLGLNNFGTYLANRFMAMLGGNLGEYANDSTSMIYDQLDPETAATCDTLKATLTDILDELLKENSELASSFIDMLVYCYASFVLYYDKTIDIIYSENPDVELIVFGMCNNLRGIVFTLPNSAGTVKIDFGSIMQIVYELMNSHITGSNEYAAKYKYVDMSGEYERIIDEIASGDMTQTTVDYIVEDIRSLGYSEEGDISRGIEAYIKAAQIEYLDLPSVMDILTKGDMSDCARHCIDNYEAATVGDKAILNLYLRSTCANGFGTHPSLKGGMQKYDALVKAYESDNTASEHSEQSVAGIGLAAFRTVFRIFENPLFTKLDEVFGSFGSSFMNFINSIRQSIEELAFSFIPDFC